VGDVGGGMLPEDVECKDAADLIDVCIRVSGDVKVLLLLPPPPLPLLLLLLLVAVAITLIECISPHTPHLMRLLLPLLQEQLRNLTRAVKLKELCVRSGLQISSTACSSA
jgi:hypothetical protein